MKEDNYSKMYRLISLTMPVVLLAFSLYLTNVPERNMTFSNIIVLPVIGLSQLFAFPVIYLIFTVLFIILLFRPGRLRTILYFACNILLLYLYVGYFSLEC